MLFYTAILFLAIILLIAFILWMISHLISYLYGIPFVVSTNSRTRSIIKLLDPKRGEKIVDLGSGDGKLLFEIAKHDSIAYGYEINPIAYVQSILFTKRYGFSNVKIYRENFLKVNLSKFDAVVIYGFPTLMPRLEQKLKKELKPGTRIVSNYFKFPNLKPKRKEGNILLYKI